MMELLVGCGADVRAMDGDYKTPLDLLPKVSAYACIHAALPLTLDP